MDFADTIPFYYTAARNPMSAFIPGFDFKDDELVITIPYRIMRIRGWPEPRSLESDREGCWKDFRPDFRLVKPTFRQDPAYQSDDILAPALTELRTTMPLDSGLQKDRAFEAFRAQLPDVVAQAIERFRSHQWNLLDLISQERATIDLVNSNPVLAYLLANNDQFRKLIAPKPANPARRLVCWKQRKIAGWLGFPESEAAVKLLRKTLPESINPHDARLLRQALLSDPGILKLLAHLRVINAGVLALVTNLKLLDAVSPRLLEEVAGQEQELWHAHTADLLVDAMYMHYMVGRGRKVPRFDSAESVREFHDVMHEEFVRLSELRRRRERRNERRQARREEGEQGREARRKSSDNKPLAPPPIPGTADIIPLTTRVQLRTEGRMQSNCVGTYHRRVQSGSTAIYRVLRPERATLSIVLGPDGFWHRSELLACRNSPVSPLTVTAIDKWLAQYSFSVSHD